MGHLVSKLLFQPPNPTYRDTDGIHFWLFTRMNEKIPAYFIDKRCAPVAWAQGDLPLRARSDVARVVVGATQRGDDHPVQPRQRGGPEHDFPVAPGAQHHAQRAPPARPRPSTVALLESRAVTR